MLRFCFAGALCALVYASVANGFEVEMEYSVDANGKPHTKILQSAGNDFAEHDRTFLTQMRNHMRAAAEASHHAHRSPLQGLFDSIDHIFNDRNEDQDPFSALHELTHRSRDAEGHTHQDFVRPHRPRGHGPILDIQRMIQSMVRPLFEPRELRHAEEGPPRPLVAMACHQDAVQYCRKYCSCWKGMTTCLERNQERLRPRCRHLLVAKGLIEEVAPEEKAMQEAKQVMPPSHLQEKLRKIHDKVTSEISATEAAAKRDLKEAEENAKHAVEEGKALIHREHHEERELEKEAELTKGEETPGYLLGDVEKPLGEKDMETKPVYAGPETQHMEWLWEDHAAAGGEQTPPQPVSFLQMRSKPEASLVGIRSQIEDTLQKQGDTHAILMKIQEVLHGQEGGSPDVSNVREVLSGMQQLLAELKQQKIADTAARQKCDEQSYRLTEGEAAADASLSLLSAAKDHLHVTKEAAKTNLGGLEKKKSALGELRAEYIKMRNQTGRTVT